MTLWVLARATGLIALVAFTLSIVLGAASSDPRSRPRDPRALDRRILKQWVHRSAGMIGLTTLALHMALIVVDTYVDVSVLGAVVPFTSAYAPVAVGIGTLATYLLVVSGLSGGLRGRLARWGGASAHWRLVHAGAYVGFILSVAHGVLAGTDTGARWTTLLYLSCTVAVGLALWRRLVRVDDRTVGSLQQARASHAASTASGARRLG